LEYEWPIWKEKYRQLTNLKFEIRLRKHKSNFIDQYHTHMYGVLMLVTCYFKVEVVGTLYILLFYFRRTLLWIYYFIFTADHNYLIDYNAWKWDTNGIWGLLGHPLKFQWSIYLS